MPVIEAEIKVDVEIEIEVWCDNCGADLCIQSTTEGKNVYITPCENCLDIARQEGHNEGHEEGYDVGYSEGEMDAQNN